jgi:hypothetical protein
MAAWRTALVPLLAIAIAGPVTPATSAGGASTTLLRLDGIGPLELGMTRTAALATGWLAVRGSGCPLGGPPLPITYRVSGSDAPSGVRGSVEFRDGRLRAMAFTRGVHTATGVRVGRTTPARMVARYRRAGYAASARYEASFQGTFVTVRRRSRPVLGGFAARRVVTTLAIPRVQTCE